MRKSDEELSSREEILARIAEYKTLQRGCVGSLYPFVIQGWIDKLMAKLYPNNSDEVSL
jgi:hypothetical protein